MITIYCNGKVHYRREDYRDPVVQEACRLMYQQNQVFGKSAYSIDWGETAEQTHVAEVVKVRKREHYLGLIQLQSKYKERFVQRRLNDLLKEAEIEIELNEDGELSEIVKIQSIRCPPEPDMSLDDAYWHLEKNKENPVINSVALASMEECANHYIASEKKNPGVIIHRLLSYVRYLESANKTLSRVSFGGNHDK
jgi:hypothetical protein